MPSLADLMRADAGMQGGAAPMSLADQMRADAAAPVQQASPAQQTAPESFWDQVKGGIASGPINAYLGVKGLVNGGLSPEDKAVLKMNQQAAAKAPVSSVVGNMAMLAPTAFIPGANTVAGASAIGAITGLVNPADNMKDRLLNAGVGGVAGAGGQYIGNKIAGALTSRLSASNAAAETANALNQPKVAALQAGQEAGYVVPPSAVNPSWINKRLESIAGKAAMSQEASVRNQGVTNSLARQAVGVPENVPLSNQALQGIRTAAGKPYQEVSGLSPIAAQDLEALKQARFDMNAYFKHYNVSADPASLAKAKEAQNLASMLEDSLTNEAQSAGRADLIPQLTQARQQIAKTYDLGRALNDTTGDVSAPVIGALLKKGKPLTNELQTVGKFSQAFPQYVRDGAKIPTPGVSKSEAILGALLGSGGAVATGNPMGAALGALPLISGPVRSMLLSKPYQAMMAKIPQQTSPETLKLIEALMRSKITQGALPALSAQGVLSSAPMLQQ